MNTIKIGEREYGLLFNGAAMFEIAERFGNKEVSKIIFASGRDGLSNLAAVISIMSKQYIAYQEYMGQTPGEAIEEDAALAALFSPAMLPCDYNEARRVVIQAVTAGFKRQVEEEDETDLVLREIEKKSTKKTATRKPTTSKSEQSTD